LTDKKNRAISEQGSYQGSCLCGSVHYEIRPPFSKAKKKKKGETRKTTRHETNKTEITQQQKEARQT
jgi:hypothetical protein